MSLSLSLSLSRSAEVEVEVEDARDVDSRVKTAGLRRGRSSVLSQDTALELPVLLARVALVLFCCRHRCCVVARCCLDGRLECCQGLDGFLGGAKVDGWTWRGWDGMGVCRLCWERGMGQMPSVRMAGRGVVIRPRRRLFKLYAVRFSGEEHVGCTRERNLTETPSSTSNTGRGATSANLELGQAGLGGTGRDWAGLRGGLAGCQN